MKDSYSPVAAHYAQTLFEAAGANDPLDGALDALMRLQAVMEQEPLVTKVVADPGLDVASKVKVLEQALGGEVSELLRAFLKMVVSLGRGTILPEIAQALLARVDEHHGRLRVTVYSAHPLPQMISERIKAVLTKREKKEILLSAEVDPKLLGGLRIAMGHRVVDASVAGQLTDLRTRLKHVRVY